MKIAISSSGKTLDSALDPRIDPADMRYEVFDNQSAAQSSGAGIQAAQFLADKNVAAVITGHVGPNAVQTLSAAGIEIFAQQHGTIREALERYKRDALKPTDQSTVSSHFGMGGGGGGGRMGQKMASGGGRGTDQGGGRGERQGFGRGMGRGGGIRRR
jgi:predicted Fe-Mo cluster-binding NifX family protein